MMITLPNDSFPCFCSFFKIFHGISFDLEKHLYSSLNSLIDSLELNSLRRFIPKEHHFPQNVKDALAYLSKYYCQTNEEVFNHSINIILENLHLMSFENFNLLQNVSLERLFTSKSSKVKNEYILFNLLLQLIQNNPSRKSLLKLISFPVVSSDSLSQYFKNISIDEIDIDLWESLKERLFSDIASPNGNIPSERWESKYRFLTREEIENIFQLLLDIFGEVKNPIDQIKILIETCSNQQKSINNFLFQNEQYQNEISTLKEELSNQMELLSFLKNENKQLKNINEQLKVEKTSLYVDYLQLKQEYEKLQQENFQMNEKIQNYSILNEQNIKVIFNQDPISGRIITTCLQEITMNPSLTIKFGMDLLRQKFEEKESKKFAAHLFKESADQNDVENCWRLAACYQLGIGVQKSIPLSRKYSQIAMEGESSDGGFWFARSENNLSIRRDLLEKESKKGHLASKILLAECFLQGLGTEKRIDEAKKLFETVCLFGDQFLTFSYAQILKTGLYNYPKNEIHANALFELSKDQPLSDCCFFLSLHQ
jgi:hypothetical protein